MRSKANRILVPIDGRKASEQAFRWTCQYARSTRSELHAIYVFEVPLEFPLNADFAPGYHSGEESLARIEAIGDEGKCKVHATILQARHAGPAVVLESEERHMNLIVLGIPSRKRSDDSPLGSTATYVLKNAPCQVILSREQASMPALPRGL